MEFKTITDTQNDLFNRREIEGEVIADSSPSRVEVVKIISEKFSVPADNIKIKTIQGKFGSRTFVVVVNIYKSKSEKDKIELRKKKDSVFEKNQSEEKENKADDENLESAEEN